MQITSQKSILGWLIPIAVAGGLCIFSATFFMYASAHTEHRPGGYAPAIIGILLFTTFSAIISYISLASLKDSVRFLTAIVIAAIESAVFSFLLLFLLVNTFGP